MQRTRIILGSASFIRPRLLDALGLQYEVVPSPADEDEVKLSDWARPAEFALQKAVFKAQPLARMHPDALVITCDSVVSRGGRVYEKPKDERELREFAADFSNSSHDVISALCVCYRGEQRTASASMTVHFGEIAGEQLDAFVASQIWRRISGGFGIYSPAARFVRRVEGDFYAGAGLPARALYLAMRELGVE